MSSYRKIVFRTIKGSFARFLAILAIIALGVGFYSGLVLTMPSFLDTGDKYVKDYHLYDYRLLSTIGFDDEDIIKIQALDGVKYASGAYSQDAIITCYSASGELIYDPQVVRFHSIMNGINLLSLEEGRLPQAPNEIVVDSYKCPSSIIGSTIKITDANDSDTTEKFHYLEYTVVGTMRSPSYMNFTRGTSNVGNGTLSFYAYVSEDAFDMEYYSEAYVYYDTDYYIYSDEYNAFADEVSETLEDDISLIINSRYDDMLEDAYSDIFEAEDTLEEERADAWAELEEGWQELLDAHDDILEAQQTLADAALEIEDGRAEIEDAREEIESNIEYLNSQEELVDSNYETVISGLEEANSTKESLEYQLDEVNATIDSLNEQLAVVQEALPQVLALEELGVELPEGTMSSTELQENEQLLLAGIDEATEGKEALEEGIDQCDTTIEELNSYLETINDSYEAIASGRESIEEAQELLSDAQNELDDGIAEYEEGLLEYEDGLIEYNDGLREYYSGLSDFQREIAAANRELDYAYRAIDKFERPDTYVLGRDTNVGYLSFENDAKIVDGIAKVFPVFFFGLAALVCSTTMQRMVSDERNEIGTMRALGYSELSIIMKYVVYSGSASVIGCIGGYAVGIKLFPGIIWSVYGMMYGFAPITYSNNWLIFVLVLIVSLICSVGVTVLTATSELKGMPAELIRPKSPPAGKRILIERIGFIWKKLKFTYKVSIRNVFRFKKRMWMMIIGIAGSTALLIAAFGIRDSVNDVINYEYDRIFTYNLAITYEDDSSESYIRESIDEANNRFGLESECILVRNENVTHQGKDIIRDITLIITDDTNISDAAKGYVDGLLMPWPGNNEIAISSKIALKNNLHEGDVITLGFGNDGESFDVTISYIFENYTYHYAFMNTYTYEKCFDKDFEADTALIVRSGNNTDEITGVSDYDFGSYISSNSDVKAWSVVKEARERFGETIKQLNSVVILVIGCAAALAFIVLFNLNNINLTERIREIATIKVLGFREGETSMYMFRENVILVIMGFIVGIPAGIILHKYIMDQIDMDMITYLVQIYPISYVYALGFIVLFSVIVDFVMRIKIKNIDMAESLKSIE